MSDDPRDAAEMWDRLQSLPSMRDEPLSWDHQAGGFVHAGQDDPASPPPPPPSSPPSAASSAPPPPGAAPAGPRRMSSSAVGAERGNVVVNPGDAPARPAAPAPSPRPGSVTVNPAAPGGASVAPASARPAAAPSRARAPRPPAPPKPPRTRRPRRRARTIRRVALAIVLVPLLLLVGLFGYGYYKFAQIPRVTVASVLSPATGAGTNYLIVGTDSRAGIDPNDPNAGAFLGGNEEPTGSRTDTIMVLRVTGDQQQLLSIPRDLWVTDPSTQQKTRINATYGAGPANLIKAVTALGIPVHHYLEINFVAFGKLVDAVGGIDIDFPFPARDTNSGLDITEPGLHHLDGTQALAYVRARHYEELKDGKWVTDPLSDLGRVQRQRAFLTALMSKVTDTRNPLALAKIGDSTSVGLKLDETLSLVDVIRLGLQLRGFHPESITLPTTPRTTTGGAAILELQNEQAAPIIAQFKA